METTNPHIKESDIIITAKYIEENKRLKEQNEKLTKALAAEMVSNQMQANIREKLEEKLEKLSTDHSLLDQESSNIEAYAILKYY